MESFEETTKSSSSKKGFFKHVFNFDEDSKTEILNIIQYSLLAIIPIIILNKISQKYVPEANDEKSSLEILAEIVSQVLLIFLGILLINRIIMYIPTYSGEKYPEFNVIYIVLAVLMITLSLQTKLGEKVSILSDRVIELWDGKPEEKNSKNRNSGNVKVSQPISGQTQGQGQGQLMNQLSALNQSLYGGGNSTPISQLPSSMEQPQQQQQQQTDYNSMYRNDYNPLQGAATPGGDEGFQQGPMAANDMLGSTFGSSFGGF